VHLLLLDDIRNNNVVSFVTTIESNPDFNLNDALPIGAEILPDWIRKHEAGTRLLNFALCWNRTEMVCHLLSKGANPNCESELWNCHPLEILLRNSGAVNDRIFILDAMFKYGAKISEKMIYDSSFTCQEMDDLSRSEYLNLFIELTQRYMQQNFRDAILEDNHALVEHMLHSIETFFMPHAPRELCTLRINPDYDAWVHGIPVLQAAELAEPRILEMLVHAGVNVNVVDCYGNNILHHVVSNGTIETLSFIQQIEELDRNSLLNMRNNKDETPEELAVRLGRQEMIDRLRRNVHSPRI
jgi:ankyrin repeat protein